MFGSSYDSLLERFISWLPNGSFTVPLELINVYNAVTDIWEAFPLLVRLAFISFFGLACLFCIFRMIL